MKTWKGWMIVHGPRRCSLGLICRNEEYPYTPHGTTGYVYVYPTKAYAYSDLKDLLEAGIWGENEKFDVIKVEVKSE